MALPVPASEVIHPRLLVVVEQGVRLFTVMRLVLADVGADPV